MHACIYIYMDGCACVICQFPEFGIRTTRYYDSLRSHMWDPMGSLGIVLKYHLGYDEKVQPAPLSLAVIKVS